MMNCSFISLQGLIEHLKHIGAERALRERIVILVLAHDSEALGMKDDSGVLAETEEDGHELGANRSKPS
jgi:hypothetical protein